MKRKGLRDFIKYSKEELESYVQSEGSCVFKINTNLHVSLGPYCLAKFKYFLLAHLSRRKIGYYDVQLNGIILDIKNIKVLNNKCHIRGEDPNIHVDLNADCYVFRPEVGAKINGVVKHISSYSIGVILYRVFNANIRFKDKLKEDVQMDQEVTFTVRNFDMQNVFPYIEGERLALDLDVPQPKTIIKQEKSDESFKLQKLMDIKKDPHEDSDDDNADLDLNNDDKDGGSDEADNDEIDEEEKNDSQQYLNESSDEDDKTKIQKLIKKEIL